MDIVVCVKQVPEAAHIGWDPDRGTLVREGIAGILNPNDKNALEAALQLKEKHGGLITAVSMGPEQADETLKEALSLGIDKTILLCDRRFAGADTLSTAYTLSLALKKIACFDLILCGKESADGMTAHVGPQLAEMLDLPQLTCATEIDVDVNGSSVQVKQKLENEHRILESPLPALITVEREINQPRITSMDLVLEACRDKEVFVWGAEDLGGKIENFGLKGSPTQSSKVYTQKVTRGTVKTLEGDAETIAGDLIEILNQKNLI